MKPIPEIIPRSSPLPRWYFDTIEIVDIILWFDGPEIVHYRPKNWEMYAIKHFIAFLVEREAGTDRFLMFSTTIDQIDTLRQTLLLADSLDNRESNFILAFDIDNKSGDVTSCFMIELANIPEQYLPTR